MAAEFPSATQALRTMPRHFARLTALLRNTALNSSCESEASHSSLRSEQAFARLECGERRDWRFAIPRADVLADVAADDGVADVRAKFFRNFAAKLDGEIRDAAARVENVGLREGLRGASVEAARTRAAEIGRRRLAGPESGIESERGENHAEEKPGA